MFVAAQFTTLAIFNDSTGKPDILLGAQVYTGILGAIMVAVSIAIFLLVRERYYEALVVKRTDKVLFRDTLYRTLRNRHFRLLLGTMLAFALATAMVGTLGYYTTLYYVCKGNVALGTQWNSAMGLAGMLMGLSGIPFAGHVARRFGKRNALVTVLVLAICAFIGDWFFYNPNIPWLQVFASGGVAFASAGFWTLYGSSMADVIDIDELETGQRREGSFAACGSWITKVGQALGNGASGYMLEITGFDSRLPVQGDDTILMIRLLLSGIPIIGLVIAVLIILRLQMTEAGVHDVRLQLEARRGQV
jgi:GPH family glycoside/pentoside/hexuronide:cation symporter